MSNDTHTFSTLQRRAKQYLADPEKMPFDKVFNETNPRW
jgi:hypothetical protein